MAFSKVSSEMNPVGELVSIRSDYHTIGFRVTICQWALFVKTREHRSCSVSAGCGNKLRKRKRTLCSFLFVSSTSKSPLSTQRMVLLLPKWFLVPKNNVSIDCKFDYQLGKSIFISVINYLYMSLISPLIPSYPSP